VNIFLRMGDVQVAFGILIHCFMQWPSYLLQCTPSSSTLKKFFISFDSSLLKMFRHFVRPRSFDNLKGPLTHKQIFILITFDGIRLMSMATIALTTYLRSLALVVSIIIVKFMVN